MNDTDRQKNKTKLVPVIDTMPADLLTPLAVYLKLSSDGSNSFLLESVEGGESLARYSFIGSNPESIVSGNDREVSLRQADGSTQTHPLPMLVYLRDHFSQFEVASNDELPAFVGGAIGCLGFNCTGWFEPTLRQPASDQPDAGFMFFRSVIAFDHAKQVIKIVTLVPTTGNASENQTLLDKAADANRDVRTKLEKNPVELPPKSNAAIDSEVESNCTQEQFEASVREIKELIAAGECYQVVLSQCFSRRTSADPVSIYRALRSINPSPYMFLLQMPDQSIVGASPEMLVKCSDRRLEYRPIAGTRQRGRDRDEDEKLAEEMRRDQKEVAEHLMLVDLGRNDLGRVAEFGSVNVDGLMNVEKYSHVQHLVSYLSARLREGLDRFDALASCFPAGTVSGAPKVRAIEIINRLEPTPRGLYAGAVGYFDYAGNMDTCIAIRTLVIKDGIASVQAGAGIVADSVPESEYLETVNKARGMLKAIEIAEERS